MKGCGDDMKGSFHQIASVCVYALQTARASSLSSQSSLPVSASLPIANWDIERPWDRAVR